MAQVHVERWTKIVSAALNKYVLSDRVKPGYVLHVKNCYAYAPEISPNDTVRIGVRNGGTDIYVRVRGTETKNTGLSALNDFFVGEGDAAFAYFPSAIEGETIELHVIGVLYRLEEWRQKIGV